MFQNIFCFRGQKLHKQLHSGAILVITEAARESFLFISRPAINFSFKSILCSLKLNLNDVDIYDVKSRFDSYLLRNRRDLTIEEIQLIAFISLSRCDQLNSRAATAGGIRS